jgi:hypothetical protein
MFVPIRDAVIVARMNEATVRRWARLGRLATSLDDDGTTLYSLTDLVRLERENREATVTRRYAELARSLKQGA